MINTSLRRFLFTTFILFIFMPISGWTFGGFYSCENVGGATINEVYQHGQLNFAEVRINDSSINPETLSIRICIQQGNSNNSNCTSYDISDAEENHPYYLLNLSNNSIRLGQNAQMDILLFRNAGIFGSFHIIYDYLSVNSYNQQQPNCEFNLDTAIDTTSNHKGIARLPDGIGPWQEIDGPGPRNDATPGASNDGGTTEPQIHHFRIEHPATALTCQSAPINVMACQNADCSQLYPNDIQINLSPTGWIGGASKTLPASSTGTYRLKHTEANRLQLGVISSDILLETGVQCFANGAASDCSIQFLNSGFVVKVENGRSCTDLAGTIQAVQKDDETNFCVGVDSFANTTRGIGFWFDYVSPSAGEIKPYLNGVKLGQTQTQATTSAAFNANAEAEFTLNYADAGQLRLHTRFVGTGADAGLEMVGESAPLSVAPHHFEVQSYTTAAEELNNTTAAGLPVQEAGLPFNVTITAVCADKTPTPNFSAATLLTSKAPFSPTAGALGEISNGELAGASFSAGRANPTNLSYTEVGNFTLEAVTTNYLGSGMDIQGSTAVGRFIPHHFELTQGSLTNRIESGCTDSDFTYLDENLQFAYTLTAKNAAGGITKNYLDTFAKFRGADAEPWPAGEVYLSRAIDAPEGAYTSLNTRLEIEKLERSADWSAGGADFTVRLNVNRNTLPDGPFEDVRFGVLVQDSDGVGILAPDLNLDTTGDGTADVVQATSAAKLLHGRIRLENAHGSELLSLDSPFYAEYFDGNAFTSNVLDACTTFALSNFKFSNDTGSNGEPALLQQIAEGKGQLSWNTPPYSPGSIDFELDLGSMGSNTPFLKYDWNGDGSYDENPSARATFGIFKGNERIIYLRETTWH